MAHDEELRMSFTEHLGELRDRLIYSAIAVVLCTVLCYSFSDALYNFVKRPLDTTASNPLMEFLASTGIDKTVSAPKAPVEWVTLTPYEGFIVKFRLGIYFGLLLSLPFLLYQICAFIFPGLNPKERSLVQYLIAGCSVLGTVGVLVAYFGVFPLVMPYLLEWTPPDVTNQLRLADTINTIMIGLVGFAVAFQFPMVVLVLVYMGIMTPASLRQHRRVAIVIMAIASSVLTPPIPFRWLSCWCRWCFCMKSASFLAPLFTATSQPIWAPTSRRCRKTSSCLGLDSQKRLFWRASSWW